MRTPPDPRAATPVADAGAFCTTTVVGTAATAAWEVTSDCATGGVRCIRAPRKSKSDGDERTGVSKAEKDRLQPDFQLMTPVVVTERFLEDLWDWQTKRQDVKA